MVALPIAQVLLLNSIFLQGFSLVLGSQSEKRAKYIYVVHCNVIDEGTPFHVHPFEGIDRVLVRHVETIWRAKTLISFQGLLYVIFKNGESLARVKVEVCSTQYVMFTSFVQFASYRGLRLQRINKCLKFVFIYAKSSSMDVSTFKTP